jgi:hypothetical protein
MFGEEFVPLPAGGRLISSRIFGNSAERKAARHSLLIA